MKFIRNAYRIIRGGLKRIYIIYCWIVTVVKLWLNGVEFKKDIIVMGIPIINVSSGAKFIIGKGFFIKSGRHFNQIGRPHPSYFTVRYNGVLTIGNNVWMSNIAIVCETAITIKDNVRFGANVVIYDSNFHSLDVAERILLKEDMSKTIRRPVIIEEGAFIGSHVTILKGITIGKNSIIGAASVVTKSVPPNEIWGGNPARFIKALNTK